MKITSHSDLVGLFNEEPCRELHLHVERDRGAHSIPYFIASGDEKLAEGTLNAETDEDGDFVNELAWAVLDDSFNDFASVTEYDSLVAGTNPAKVH